MLRAAPVKLTKACRAWRQSLNRHAPGPYSEPVLSPAIPSGIPEPLRNPGFGPIEWPGNHICRLRIGDAKKSNFPDCCSPSVVEKCPKSRFPSDALPPFVESRTDSVF